MKHRILRLYKSIQETIKNLNNVEKLFEGLYRKDIQTLMSSIAYTFGVVSLIQTFFKLSLKKRAMTKLLLSCLNQFVRSSVDYLNDTNTATFWKQPKNLMIEKLEKCIELRDHVFKTYSNTLNVITAEGRESFKLLFVTTFGNFVLFINRLIKVSKYCHTVNKLLIEMIIIFMKQYNRIT